MPLNIKKKIFYLGLVVLLLTNNINGFKTRKLQAAITTPAATQQISITGQPVTDILHESDTQVLQDRMTRTPPIEYQICDAVRHFGGSPLAKPIANTSSICTFKPNNLTCCSPESLKKLQSWWEDIFGTNKESRAARYTRRLHSLIEETRTLLRWQTWLLNKANSIGQLPAVGNPNPKCMTAAQEFRNIA